jgi:hypothetical protein
VFAAQQGALPMRAVATVTEGVRPCCVVAARDLADPIRGVARYSRDGRGGESTRQEPEEVPATTLDGVISLAVPLMQFVVSQIRLEADAFGHAPVLQHFPVTRYHRQLSVMA